MYGVPQDLDLGPFLGDCLIQICLGQFQEVFSFSRGRHISVEGGWELRDSAGDLLDHAIAHADRDCYRVHAILGATVLTGEVNSPRSFTLHFDNGMSLKVCDDQDAYESFCIQPGNIFV